MVVTGSPVLDVYTGTEEVRSLLPLWEDLAAAGGANVFLSGEWMDTWCGIMETRVRPIVLVVRDADGHPVGLAPFYAHRRGERPLPLRWLRLMGTGFGADHLSFLCRPGRDISKEVAAWITSDGAGWDVAELRWLEEGQARRLASAVEPYEDYRCVLIPADDAPFIRLPATWEEYERRLSKDRRSELRRHERRLRREHGAVIYGRAGAPDFARVWSAMIHLHQARWRQRGLAGSFAKPRFEELHRRFAARALRRAWLRLYYLAVGEQVIAVDYGFRYGPQVMTFQGGFDLAWSRYAPGRLLMAYAIRNAIEEGATEFDLMRGAESYKFDWRPELRRDYHALIFRQRPYVVQALRVRGVAQRWHRWLRQWLPARRVAGPQPR